MKRIKYYLAVIRWMWNHRTEKDCRQKWRRMERELKADAKCRVDSGTIRKK